MNEFRQAINFLNKKAQTVTAQDVRTLQGVNQNLFGPQSWLFLNQFANLLNQALYNLSKNQRQLLGNQPINFQTLARNPSISTHFSGGLKHIVDLSMLLWSVISNKGKPYSIEYTRELISKFMAQINTMDIPEISATGLKAQLITALNNWLSILK